MGARRPQRARMALDLNLHLRTEKESFDQLGPEAQDEETGRIHTFWGAFISDQCVSPSIRSSPNPRRITSLTLGRLPQLLTNAITVELPPVDEAADEEPWGPADSPAKRRPGAPAPRPSASAPPCPRSSTRRCSCSSRPPRS